MQLEAIYNSGKLEFIQPVRFVNEPVRLMVLIPDEKLFVNVADDKQSARSLSYKLPAEVLTQAEAMEKRLDAVRNAPLPDDNDLSPLSSKQMERIQAIAPRNDIKGGR